ncbi:hypothetical protein V7S43_016783 [Phytophthora oleae]|uniref:Uncharacterized protein n=1 Tax=Phytophthora oleae TaxID=2107226 RepID=A0ABD3EV27_9STRA
METTNPEHLKTMNPPTMSEQPLKDSTEIVPAVAEAGDVIPLQRDATGNCQIVTYDSTHPMITRSCTHHIYEIDDPEEAGAFKKKIILPSTTGSKR